MGKTITFKNWIRDIHCSGDMAQHSEARAIWESIPDNGQGFRDLDLRFATIHNGRLYDIFAELWQMYSEFLDTERK